MLHHVYQRVVCKDKFQHTLPLLIEKSDMARKRNRILPYNNVAHQNPTSAAISGDVSLTMSRFV